MFTLFSFICFIIQGIELPAHFQLIFSVAGLIFVIVAYFKPSKGPLTEIFNFILLIIHIVGIVYFIKCINEFNASILNIIK